MFKEGAQLAMAVLSGALKININKLPNHRGTSCR